MRFADCPLLWRADRLVPMALCRSLIADIEAGNPVPASSSRDYRDQDRIFRDDTGLAATLFALLRPHLPDSIGGLSLVGLNERLRLYRYRPGQRFLPHMDHWYEHSATRISLLTVLVYLNDDFEGGETRFMEQIEQTVTPAAGSAIVFQHKVRHEGCPVRRGTKYALRTDVMYEAERPVRLTLA